MSPNSFQAQQRAVQAKAKVKAESERLSKENPVLAKMKEKQAAKLKAKLSGEVPTTDRKGKKGTETDRKATKKGKDEEEAKEGEAQGENDEAKKAEEQAKKEEAEAKKKEEAKAKKKKKKEEEVRELPPDQNPVDAEWTAASWLKTLDLQTVISAALKPPDGDGNGAAFTYVRSLERAQVEAMLTEAGLIGLVRAPASSLTPIPPKLWETGDEGMGRRAGGQRGAGEGGA